MGVGGNTTPLSLYPQERASVPIVQEADLLSGMVWTGYVKSTLSPPPPVAGTTNCPARNDWLYGLRCPCGYKKTSLHINSNLKFLTIQYIYPTCSELRISLIMSEILMSWACFAPENGLVFCCVSLSCLCVQKGSVFV